MTLIGRLQAASEALNRVVIVICVACLVIMLCISFVGSFYMVATGDSLSWTYSLARLFVPWIGMLSITVAFKGGEHVAMAVLVQRLPSSLISYAGYVCVGLTALFAILTIWYGWLFFLNSTQYYMVSDQLQVHHRWVASCVPVSGLVLLVHVVNGFSLIDPVFTRSGRMPRRMASTEDGSEA